MGQRLVSPNRQGLPMPGGAWPIAQARRQGLKPAEAVIVSYVGETPWQGPHVHCDSGKAYDWAWSEGLSLVIVVANGTDATDAIRGCFWPEHHNRTGFPTLIDIENRRVAYIVRLVPKPALWHLLDTSEHFPAQAFKPQETAACS